MPLYYFDFVDRGLLSKCDAGIQFADDEAARGGAIAAIAERAKKQLASKARGTLVLHVWNEHGASVAEVEVSLKALPLQPGTTAAS